MLPLNAYRMKYQNGTPGMLNMLEEAAVESLMQQLTDESRRTSLRLLRLCGIIIGRFILVQL
jgi:hypothetical protein